jgi:hypothetical protein
LLLPLRIRNGVLGIGEIELACLDSDFGSLEGLIGFGMRASEHGKAI